MEKIRLYYDSRGNSLNVWFDDPKKEYNSEETGEEVILAKDRKGRVIGFEKLNYLPHPGDVLKSLKTIPVEVLVSQLKLQTRRKRDLQAIRHCRRYTKLEKNITTKTRI